MELIYRVNMLEAEHPGNQGRLSLCRSRSRPVWRPDCNRGSPVGSFWGWCSASGVIVNGGGMNNA